MSPIGTSEEDIVALNATLARELGVAIGAKVTLRVQKATDVHRETWLGRSDANDTVGAFR